MCQRGSTCSKFCEELSLKLQVMAKKKVFKIVGMGEVLWDMLPSGRELGGAPANFTYHAAQLGAEATLISAVGPDKLGQEAVALLKQKRVNHILYASSRPTGTVEVTLKEGIPFYDIMANVAWDDMAITPPMANAVAAADAICFGSLVQRGETSRGTIRELLEMAPMECLLVFDINLRQHFYSREVIEESLFYANILKVNEDELEVLSEMFGLTGSPTDRCNALLTGFGLAMVVLTLGANGSYLFAGKEKSFLAAPKVAVADTVGAGDAFTAALVDGILREHKLAEIHRQAVTLSAFVCTQKGAMPIYPKELRLQ